MPQNWVCMAVHHKIIEMFSHDPKIMLIMRCFIETSYLAPQQLWLVKENVPTAHSAQQNLIKKSQAHEGSCAAGAKQIT